MKNITAILKQSLYDAQRLTSIRERLAVATPGPWVQRKFDECQTIIHAKDKLPQGGNRFVCTVSVGENRPEGNQNADLIAHAPDDLRYLLSCIEELNEELNAALIRTGEISA